MRLARCHVPLRGGGGPRARAGQTTFRSVSVEVGVAVQYPTELSRVYFRGGSRRFPGDRFPSAFGGWPGGAFLRVIPAF